MLAISHQLSAISKNVQYATLRFSPERLAQVSPRTESVTPRSWITNRTAKLTADG
jgi:hypothetical protein